ncbi:GNAT family N-acetyltransferase [Paenibacillus sp. NPDC057967]|uniref:GNAT family N-acetyltransferase n=1 Tax=Paenibacillus sp. NPDC057967 TaxID=3346293 RepID=UPI0036D950E4
MPNHTISYRLANIEDAPLLAEMNQQLIQDEGSANPMKLNQLVERMTAFLQTEWQAAILLRNDEPVGYALYQERSQNHRPEQTEVFIRQYVIDRRYRQQGLGRQGLAMLEEKLFPHGCNLAIDVLQQNEAGRAFWSSIGFKPYSIHMKKETD